MKSTNLLWQNENYLVNKNIWFGEYQTSRFNWVHNILLYIVQVSVHIGENTRSYIRFVHLTQKLINICVIGKIHCHNGQVIGNQAFANFTQSCTEDEKH